LLIKLINITIIPKLFTIFKIFKRVEIIREIGFGNKKKNIRMIKKIEKQT
jgi:hypothetical protein